MKVPLRKDELPKIMKLQERFSFHVKYTFPPVFSVVKPVIGSKETKQELHFLPRNFLDGYIERRQKITTAFNFNRRQHVNGD